MDISDVYMYNAKLNSISYTVEYGVIKMHFIKSAAMPETLNRSSPGCVITLLYLCVCFIV